MHIVYVAVIVIVYAVAGDFTGIRPDVVGQIRVGVRSLSLPPSTRTISLWKRISLLVN